MSKGADELGRRPSTWLQTKGTGRCLAALALSLLALCTVRGLVQTSRAAPTAIGRLPATTAGVPASQLPGVRVLSSTLSGLSLEVRVAQPSVVPSTVEGRFYAQAALEGYADGDGLPEQTIAVGVPAGAQIDLQVEPGPSVELPGHYRLSPPVAWRAGRDEMPSTLIAVAVGADTSLALPASSLAEIVGDAFLRDQRIVTLRLRPVGYDARRHTLQYTPHFRVRLRFDGAPTVNSTPHPDPYFDPLLDRILINADTARSFRAAPAPAVRAGATFTLPEVSWRIGVTVDGIYRLSYEDLSAAGVPVAGVQPDDVHLYSQGQEVALHFEGSGPTFDPGEAFLFYGQKFRGSVWEEKYTDENVYWLVVDATTPGRRMAVRDVAPGTAPLAPYFTTTTRAENYVYYWALHSVNVGIEDTWFGDRIVTSSGTTRTYPITLTAFAGGSYSATVRVQLAARSSSSSANPDHRTRLLLNGTPLVDELWDGQVAHTTTVQIPAGVLQDGRNTLSLAVYPQGGLPQDMYFNYVQIENRRLFSVTGDTLAFDYAAAGTSRFLLPGFTTSTVQLLEVTDAATPVWLSGAVASLQDTAYTLAFESEQSRTARYVAQGNTQVRAPEAIQRYQRPDLYAGTNGADYVIIAPDLLYTSTLPLAAHRSAQGLRTQVIRAEDVYNLFGDGIFGAAAIRDFLAYAYAHWAPPAPSFVVLVGDGNWNFKGHNPSRYGAWVPSLIPPYLAIVDPHQGETGSDNMYASIVGDDAIPDLYLGRLAASSITDVQNVVAKLIAFDTAPLDGWHNRLVLSSDNTPDPAGGGDFQAVAEHLATYALPGTDVRRVYLNDYCEPQLNLSTCPAASLALTQTWGEGAGVLIWVGHGATNRWAHEQILQIPHVDTLTTSPGLPFVLSLDCMDGYFIWPPNASESSSAQLSLAEKMTLAPGRGSVASFAPCGLGHVASERAMAEAILEQVYQDGELQLGPLTMAGRLALNDIGDYLLHTYTLFGDPFTILPLSIPRAVTGTVRGALMDLPLQATVQASGRAGTFGSATDLQGAYAMTIPKGTYTFTVTPQDGRYLGQMLTGVPVTGNRTLNFTLSPVTTHTISGTVSQAGTGDPLAATVTLIDVPWNVPTDPATGFYSLTVPPGTYTLRAEAPAHAPAQHVLVVDGNRRQDFQLSSLNQIFLPLVLRRG